MKKRLLTALLSLSACDSNSNSSAMKEAESIPTLAMHDISIMFPQQINPMGTRVVEGGLTYDSSGEKGRLLPEDLRPTNKLLQSSDTVLTAFRIDPCFPNIDNLDKAPELCQAQLRLVFVKDLNLLHASYSLSQIEFKKLLNSLAELGDHSPEALAQPLGVHPILAKEGADGPTGKAMKKLILTYASVQNLAGFTTSMQSGFNPMPAWSFRGFVMKDGKPVDLEIPTLDKKTSQRFSANRLNNSYSVKSGTEEDRLEFDASNNDDAFVESIKTLMSPEFKNADSNVIAKEMETLASFDDPTKIHFNNASCVSCHISNELRQNLAFGRKDLDLSVSQSFKSKHNLEAKFEGSVLLNFTNFAIEGEISPRVANETAHTLDAILSHKLYQ